MDSAQNSIQGWAVARARPHGQAEPSQASTLESNSGSCAHGPTRRFVRGRLRWQRRNSIESRTPARARLPGALLTLFLSKAPGGQALEGERP